MPDPMMDAVGMQPAAGVGWGVSRAEHAAAREAAHRLKVAKRRAALVMQLAGVSAELAPFAKVVLEVGCGHGHFLTAYAASHLEEACVGLDFCNQRVKRALRKMEHARVRNLHFVRAEASEFLDALPDEVRFSRVYVLFPDPWPKKRHAKNRLMSPGFLSRLASRAGPGADLFFRTDSASYYRQTCEVLGALPAWRLVPGDPWPFEQPTVFQQKATEYYSLAAIRT
jgi:tRNA (guanine-N7-)-methyltransferase